MDRLELQDMNYSASASRSSSTTCSALSYSYKDPSSPKLLTAAHYLSELVGNYNTDKLCKACYALAELIGEADRDCLHLLSEKDVVGVVVKVMESLPSHASAQQAGCGVLLRCNQQIELRSSIEDRNAYQCVLAAMKTHPNDVGLLKNAVSALASFAETALCDTGLKESKAYSYVLKVMSQHKFETVIQSEGLKALAHLLRNDQYAVSTMARQGEHVFVMEALPRHSSNPEVVAYGFQTLQIFASNDGGMGILLEVTDILVLLMEQLQLFSDNEMVVEAASGLINVLTAAEVDTKEDLIVSMESASSRASTQSQLSNQMGQLGVLHLLTDMLDRYTEVLEIQVHVFSSIEHICVLPDIKVSESMMKQWLYLLNDAFHNHWQEPTMMEAGCRCLARMLELNPNLNALIHKKLTPLLKFMWLALLGQSHQPEPTVFKAITMAMFFLVEDDESMQKLFLEKGACEAILECLREYLTEESRNNSCMEYGCRALRALLRFQNSDDQKKSLVKVGIVGDLSRILDDFIGDPEVITEVFCVIACLADHENFQTVVLQGVSLCKLVLSAVDRHTSHEILVESALEVLILLSQNDKLVAQLHDFDVLGLVVAIMRKYVVSQAIQCKGCLLLRLLSDHQYLLSKPLCTSIAKVVIDALSWKTDSNVLMEALACIYILCECSMIMSQTLIDGDVHLILFTLLYRDSDEDGVFRNRSNATDISLLIEEDEKDTIFQIGTDVIYMLSCIRDFKQQMLITAVRDSMLEGVKVLIEIGADVNHGEEGNTPICLAVQSNKKPMVEFLLQHGVNNIHKALAISRERKLDEITGLLLEHIGLERNGDVINLSGLELEIVKPTWILPSLGVKYSPVRRKHRRDRSLGKLNIMLKHRQSIDLGKTSLHSLQGSSGILSQGSTGILSPNRESVAGIESITRSKLFKTGRSARQERTSLFSPLSPSDIERDRMESDGNETDGMRNEDHYRDSAYGDSDKKSKKSSYSSIGKKLKSALLYRSSRSNTPSSDDGQQSSGEHSYPKKIRNLFSRGSKTPDNIQNRKSDSALENLVDTSIATSQPKSSRTRKLGVVAVQPLDESDAYEPRLSPIKGTPTHKASKPLPNQEIEDIDSGFGMAITNEIDTEILEPQSPTEENKSYSSRKPPRNGTITGVEISRLLFVSNDNRRLTSDDTLKQSQIESNLDYTISPEQLCRKIKRFKRPKKKKASSSSIFYTQLDSIPSVVSNQADESIDSSMSSKLTPRQPFENTTPLPLMDSTLQAPIESDTSTNIEQSAALDTSPYMQSMELSFQRSSTSSFHSSGSRDEVDFGASPDQEEVETISTKKLITRMDLSSNNLTGLQELCEDYTYSYVLPRLRELRILDLKQNQIASLPRKLMQELVELTNLNASCNLFTVFPEEAVLSLNLKSLDLSGNKISTIPPLPVLPNLTRLNLSKNQLEAFPQTMSPSGQALTPRLKFLNLQSNHISSVARHDTKLRDLEELNISRNKILKLPNKFLANLISLKILDGSRNELIHIAGEVAQDLVNLITLKMAHNNLGMYEADFHLFITSAPVIQSVDATENCLSSLPPPYAWRSRALRDIRMTGNKLTKLDLSDGKKFWPHLECLYLAENKLKEIPKEIGSLSSLSCLDISHNRDIRQLPNEMGNLDHLFMLHLQGLKNLSLDPSLQNGSTKAIISYLKSRYTRSVPYYHMKLMVVGAAAKGKTTLLNLLTSDKPLLALKEKGAGSQAERNMATLGVSVRNWSYPYKPGGHGSVVNYHISCWDFAGQEEFYSTHQCFLSKRSLYVLVYNLALGESELQNLLPWLLNVQARAPSSPVLIVGTHSDKLSQEEFKHQRILMRDKIREMLKKPGFPGDISYGEVSCFDEGLVSALRKKVKMLIDGAKLRGQKIMGGMVPSNYLELEGLIQKEKKRLERTKSKFPVLQASRLRELMNESKLSQKMDKTETDRAIQFLHECGVLLYYSDFQTKLSELYFLHPEWLCILMAQIITIPEINPFISKEGLMMKESIYHVLREPRFPSEFQPEYIRLLERFEVALRQTPSTLLIPSHLPKEKPSQGISLPEHTPSSRIMRRYNLCYIPPGFWPRLVARLITLPLLPAGGGGRGIPTREVWLAGMYTHWDQECYFLIEQVREERNSFDIIVPTSNLGTKLLCSIVDNVEALIDEWFPGLRELDITTGSSLVKPLCLCPLCPDHPHCFPLNKLVEVALSMEEIDCPAHNGPVPLEQLAPDIVISDLEPCYKVAPGEFILEEITKNVLGKGGFGEVFKAEFRGQAVAVKVFSQKVAAINNTTPNHLIRQEVQILSRCKHPYIIAMIAVTLRPKPMLFLEFAELGSLNSLYPYTNLNRTLKHRIAFQVAGALAFLHKCKVIYRDLKPGNVLIFSLSTLAKVNAKLSDYGISCFATEGGLTQNMGTAGYKAPELLLASHSSMAYNEKVDIYSYGLMLFVMMTNGHKPFEELNAGYEIDKFIIEGRPINDIEHYGCPSWPDMQDIINHCLQYSPSNRPTAQEVFTRMCSTEFMCLKRAVQVERERTIQMFATRYFRDKQGTKNVEVWMASVLGSSTMISIMNLSVRNASPQGMMLPPNNEIQSMLAIEHRVVAMGTTSGNLFIYDGRDRQLKHQLATLEDSILCLTYFRSQSDVIYLCAGLANGLFAYYDQSSFMKPNGQPRLICLGNKPVTSMQRYRGRLYIGHGSNLIVLRLKDWSIEQQWNTVELESGHIRGIAVGKDVLWTTHIKTPKIQVWDLEDGRHTGTLHCDTIVNSLLPKDQTFSPAGFRVTSMHLQPHPYSTLWLGLSSGHLLVVNASSRVPLMITKRHRRAIRYIQSVKALISEKPVNLILTAGFGFLQRPGHEHPMRGTPESYGNLLVWESVMPRLKQDFDEIKKRMAPFN